MTLKTVRTWMLVTALGAFALAASALPSLDAVKAEVQKGNYAQAQAMMEEVVAAKPSSARAHYVYAEILAHNKRFDEAARQATTASTLDPAIGFTDPAKFRAFEALLEREQREAKAPVSAALIAPTMAAPAAPATAAPERSADIPGWVWIAGGLAFAGLAWSALRRPAPSAPMAMPTPTPMPTPMDGPAARYPATAGGLGYGAMPPQQGSGLLGVGLAAAGGVAAGMLAERLMEGGHHESMAAAPSTLNQDGLVPGIMFDDASNQPSAAYELEQQSVDFGSGADWADDVSGAGSDDW